MKKIKFIISFVVIIVLIVGVSIFINKKDYSYYLVMGDYISNDQNFSNDKIASFSSLVGNYLLEEGEVNEVNSSYLKNNMTSKKLLEMIESDVYKANDSKLVDLIKKSKYISITLGVNDIIKQLKYDSYNDRLAYDKEVVKNKIEIFKHNYSEILNEIKDINSDVKILLVGCYNLYGEEELTSMINNAIEDISNDFSVSYIDISDINDNYLFETNKLYLTNYGQEVISSKVIKVIKEIE